jgi:hypothetical protein
MARKYSRDNRGRFASGGGGGGGGSKGKAGGGGKSKAAMTKAADKARAADLRAKGTTGLGMRVKAKGFGGKKAKETSGGLLTSGRATAAPSAGRISGKASVRAAGAEKRAKAAQRKASKAGMKPGTRMSKAAPSAAKAAFKALRSEQRSADRKGMTEAFFGNTKASRAYGAKKGAATRKLKTMIANRGVSKKRGK